MVSRAMKATTTRATSSSNNTSRRFPLWLLALLVFGVVSLISSQKSLASVLSALSNFEDHSESESSQLSWRYWTSSTATATATASTNISISTNGSSSFSPTTISSPSPSPYAYAFVTWRLDPSNPTGSYRGYLSNMMVAAKVLRKHGSKADVIATFKLDISYPYETIPNYDAALLTRCGIQIRYLAKQDDSKFNVYATMFNKFIIFNMTEYRRVLYLDSDILPIGNMDYLFEQSDDNDDQNKNGILKPMVLVAGLMEPANGGTVLVTPNATDYEEIQKVIRKQGKLLGKMRLFDEVNGWGHKIEPPDFWEMNLGQRFKQPHSGIRWNFWAAGADQGFAYHYCKYIKKHCTQILGRKIYNFGPGPNGTTIVEKEWTVTITEKSPLARYSPKTYNFIPKNCRKFSGGLGYSQTWPGCVPPWSDYDHFTGPDKPWTLKPPPLRQLVQLKSSTFLWWKTLVDIQNDLQINSTWFPFKLPSNTDEGLVITTPHVVSDRAAPSRATVKLLREARNK